MKPRWFVVRVDVFEADVTVAINMTERDVETRVFRHANDKTEIRRLIGGWDAEKTVHGAGGYIEGCGYLIMLKVDKKLDISVLVHETLHVCFTMLIGNGLHPSRATEEAYCYLQAYLVKEILKRLSNG